jgi:hypothetical protein
MTFGTAWHKLPLKFRQRWWREMDYSRRPPSLEFLAQMPALLADARAKSDRSSTRPCPTSLMLAKFCAAPRRAGPVRSVCGRPHRAPSDVCARSWRGNEQHRACPQDQICFAPGVSDDRVQHEQPALRLKRGARNRHQVVGANGASDEGINQAIIAAGYGEGDPTFWLRASENTGEAAGATIRLRPRIQILW